jgi:hypothetical protein
VHSGSNDPTIHGVLLLVMSCLKEFSHTDKVLLQKVISFKANVNTSQRNKKGGLSLPVSVNFLRII